LFLTRDGPIEVTLKPSFVLTGILVSMAGVAAIFYYTLIASYSAIEVMRDETIQTAEASIGKKHIGVVTNRVMTWQEYQPSSSIEHFSPEGKREHVEPSRTITESTNNSPESLIPKASPDKKSMDEDASDYLPMIIQGGKRITFADGKKTESSEKNLNVLSPKELAKDPIKSLFPLDSAKTSKPLVADTKASPVSTNQKNTRKSLEDANIKSPAKTKLGTEILDETSIRTSPALAQENKIDEVNTPGLAIRAREYAVALMPNFMTEQNSVKQNADAEKTEVFEKNRETSQGVELAGTASAASGFVDDGLLTSKNNTQRV